MRLTTLTEPPFEPVTLSEVWAHLRIVPADSPQTYIDDDLLRRLTTSARQEVEAYTQRSLIERKLRLSVRGFTGDDYTIGHSADYRAWTRGIRLLMGDVSSVSSVQYYDAANALQTVDATSYYVTDDQVPELRFVTTFSAPALYERPDAVRVEYWAGYTPDGSPPVTQAEYASAVPRALKDAILIGVQLLYDDLSPQDAERYRAARDSLAHPYRLETMT